MAEYTIDELFNKFHELYGSVSGVGAYFAPGRVNLIGEHTDYNGGHVFPCALTIGTYGIIRKNGTKSFRFCSLNMDEKHVINVDPADLEYNEMDGWVSYCKGIIWTFEKRGYHITEGADILIYGDIPAGSGLSSSASLEVLMGLMLKDTFGFDIPMQEIAVIGQYSENNYNGMNCGIMDQFASAMGKKDCAIFLDTNTLDFEYAPVVLPDAKIIITNSHVKHSLVSSAYNDRRRECENALQEMKKAVNVNTLGDLTNEEFEKHKSAISDDICRKRAKHAVYENQRTIKAVAALKNNDVELFGKLMNESHISLRDDYETSCAETDILAELAWNVEGVIGSRITGGGFGGCTVSIVKNEAVDRFIEYVGKEYTVRTGKTADFYVVDVGEGAHRISMLSENIYRLVQYGIITGLIPECEKIYTTNLLLDLFGEDEYTEPEESYKKSANVTEGDLENILEELLKEAVSRGIISDSIAYRDLFDTKIMNCLVPRPMQVREKFAALYEKSSKDATDWFYKLSQDSNYIRRYRVKKDMKWTVDSPYGVLDITINLSKPEKDPKAIAAAGKAKSSSYPKCQLCVENEGYAGRLDHPARENHRIIPITINGSQWGFQYSPYVYYNEHCIVFNGQHVPMKINRDAFCKLFDFVKQFPHYMLGSNADLPIVGGSILSHDHFQGGNYTFAMAKAPIEIPVSIPGYEDVEAGIVKWPMSVIRIRHKDSDRLIDLAEHILNKWREYTDESAFVLAETDGEPHNTITPIARKKDGMFELDLTLRNNITTKEHPLGVYHPHEELHHIKKENIGLIEVMGLAILPSRLKKEMELLKNAILSGSDIHADETIAKHADWAEQFMNSYKAAGTQINKDNIEDILKQEIGKVFIKVLEDAGVYKCDKQGREAFMRFINIL